jgi:S-adenosylmethionine decarboxylase
MGIHIIAELFGVDGTKISRVSQLRSIMDKVISLSGLSVVASSFHQFKPHGVSAVYLLRESHLSVHTWPEHSYVALDIFSCASEEKAFKAFELLVEEFQPKTVKKKVLRREIDEASETLHSS